VTLRSFTTLVLLFLACVAVAYLVSWLILRLYQRAVVRSMALASRRESAPDPAVRTSTSAPGQPLGFVYANETASAGSRFAAVWALDGPRRTALVYLVAGLCFAVTMFLIMFRSQFSSAVYAARLVLASWVFAWPAMLVWKIVTGVSWRGWFTGLVVYYFTGVALAWAHGTLFPADRFEYPPLGIAFGMWAGFNWGMTVAVPIFTARRVRAVGVLVLTVTMLASLGAQDSRFGGTDAGPSVP
jgi:hypothetical protein